MRTVAEIDADIAELEVQLSVLHEARRKAASAWRGEIIADFDGGKDIMAIVKERRLPYGSVQGVLWRAGRTQGGRMAMRQQVHAATRGAPA